MKLFSLYGKMYVLLLMMITTTKGVSQSLIQNRLIKIDAQNIDFIDLKSSYTNVEFQSTDDELLSIEAVMEVEGLSQKKFDSYFKKWNMTAINKNGRVVINSFLEENDTKHLAQGYYNGYFLDKDEIDSEIGLIRKRSSNLSLGITSKFDHQAYIEEGNSYLLKWQKEHKEPIGKRWFDKTREERIELLGKSQTKKSKNVPKTKVKPKGKLPNRLQLQSRESRTSYVRSLPDRAIISKTLRIKIPKHTQLNIDVRHGKVSFLNEIFNLKAKLNYALLTAGKLLGKEIYIKGAFSNLEVNYWESGILDVNFSGYAFIKHVSAMTLISNVSTVSIDKITESIDASGNFKMLSIDLSPKIRYVNIDIEDSKKVWIKLPDNLYNFHYTGISTKVILPERFSLFTTTDDPTKQVAESILLENKETTIDIKALSCVMQIYDIPWEELKVKTLEGL